jgi:hypothetical protein
MLYRKIMAVCSEIHTKHINTLCGQNVESQNVEPFNLMTLYKQLSAFPEELCCMTLRSYIKQCDGHTLYVSVHRHVLYRTVALLVCPEIYCSLHVLQSFLLCPTVHIWFVVL